jgi:hypothetical protein
MRKLLFFGASSLVAAACLDFDQARELCENRGDCLRTGQTVELTATVPANMATDVPVSTQLKLTFSEAMDKPSVQVVPSPGIALGAPSWNVDDTEVTFTTTAPLSNATLYTVAVSGRSRQLGPLADGTRFTFTTVAASDTTAPTLEGTVPPDLSLSSDLVALDARLQLIFSEAMARDAGELTVSAQPAHVFGDAVWTGDGKVATFNVNAQDFTPSTLYTVTVDGRDLAGNALAGDKTVQFRTGTARDMIPPTVVSTSPDAGATDVSVFFNPEVVFSEAMSPATVTASISIAPPLPGFACVGDGTATRFTCSHAQAFAELTQYSVTVGIGAEDGSGNNLAAPYVWSFTTGLTPDLTPPRIVSTSPAPGTTGTVLRPPIVVTFDEPMNTATVEAAFSVSMPASPPSGTFSWDGGAEMIYSFSADFPYGSDVRYRFGSGALDLAGNEMMPNQEFTFRTRRLLSATLNSVTSGAFDDVNILSNGTVYGGVTSTALMSGDIYASGINDLVVRSLFSFDLAAGLDPTAITIESATLLLNHSGDPGTPFGGNASIYLFTVNIPAPGGFQANYLSAFNASPICVGTFTQCMSASNCWGQRVASAEVIEQVSLNVLSSVRYGFNNGRRASFRLSRQTDPTKINVVGCPDAPAQVNTTLDAVYINSGNAGMNKPALTVGYTAH